ncbi:SDR family oxidoreductase [Corynebacterium pseudopelargi]|uniref:2,3-dihydro-2,3-dihydroxybenzoate dehydrogenase n=1 Tax=Corynebacterium pseudopelargi TaxID=2080757 RepID=A0A3G6IWJ7_9CORY|nr:SDR family oxidoreductase [Corynebacterium pseudopelargi]AZA10016.1 2,3-dihydro-2,3-dihydroxybenzoate dehydrogenase [Corynebacterium pseudopelargi]
MALKHSEDLEHRGHCLITGAKGGIGQATCDLLLEHGYSVSRWDLPEVDVSDPESIAHHLQALPAPVDYLIHTAGVLRPDSALQPDWDAIRQSVAINLEGVIATCSPIAQQMAARKRGAIVVVTSNAAAVPRSGMAAYGASKAAAKSWVHTLGLELAPYGVRCNTVSPGSTDTPMLRGMWHEPSDTETQLKQRHQEVIAGNPEAYRLGIPLQRVATPEDIAQACLWLISPQSRHITMHDLRVDGGATLDA